jgi:hypothetical protein
LLCGPGTSQHAPRTIFSWVERVSLDELIDGSSDRQCRPSAGISECLHRFVQRATRIKDGELLCSDDCSSNAVNGSGFRWQGAAGGFERWSSQLLPNFNLH